MLDSGFFLSLDERIEIVDDKNRVIGLRTRGDAYREGLKHRAANVLVLNEQGELLVQKRASNKAFYPDFWDLSCAEHVKPGESFKKAAERGLLEELGIKGAQVRRVRPVHFQKNEFDNAKLGFMRDYEFVELYETVWNGEIKLDEKEVGHAEFMSVGRVQELVELGETTPWFVEEWNWLKKRSGL